MEVYVDNMLVKNVHRTDHLQHLDKAFDLLRQYKVKLNPEKCTLRIASRKFLEYLVAQWGIKTEIDSGQISTILNMKSPNCMKEVQMLNGHLVALNRLISRSTDKCRPFFQALEGMEPTSARTKNARIFQGLKSSLTSPPLLSKPSSGETISLPRRLESAVSGALVWKDEGVRSRCTRSATP